MRCDLHDSSEIWHPDMGHLVQIAFDVYNELERMKRQIVVCENPNATEAGKGSGHWFSDRPGSKHTDSEEENEACSTVSRERWLHPYPQCCVHQPNIEVVLNAPSTIVPLTLLSGGLCWYQGKTSALSHGPPVVER